MTDKILNIESISELHNLLNIEKPKHPLISIIDVADLKITKEMINIKTSANLYYIGIKNTDCGLQYGRNQYDFQEGVLAFHGPRQEFYATTEQEFDKDNGWLLFFHPDLIRNSNLGNTIEEYTFFSYDVYEALHLSEKEKFTITDCINKIREEYNERIDKHSQKVIISNLELLLNYCSRFYERQFNTRTNQNKEFVSKFNSILKEYYKSGKLTEIGLPSLEYISNKINLSGNYLSDLLKKETGRSAKDHINDFIIEKAKNLLLSTNKSISEIAFDLGFNYPHYFSRLFKTKTGNTPQYYRNSDFN